MIVLVSSVDQLRICRHLEVSQCSFRCSKVSGAWSGIVAPEKACCVAVVQTYFYGRVHERAYYGQVPGLVSWFVGVSFMAISMDTWLSMGGPIPYASVILKRRRILSIYEVWYKEKQESVVSIFMPKNRRVGLG